VCGTVITNDKSFVMDCTVNSIPHTIITLPTANSVVNNVPTQVRVVDHAVTETVPVLNSSL